MTLVSAVVGCFLGDLDVVDVAFLHARAGFVRISAMLEQPV